MEDDITLSVFQTIRSRIVHKELVVVALTELRAVPEAGRGSAQVESSEFATLP